MATYTSGLSADGVLRHLPLGQALREYASAGDKAKLLQILAPVQQASEACAWLKNSARPFRSWLCFWSSSLLANWALEAARFTPRLKILVAHPSFLPADELRSMNATRLAATDLVVTSYATLLRLGWIYAPLRRLVHGAGT